GLGEGSTVVDERVDHWLASEFGVAAYHQVAASDLLDIDSRGQFAARHLAQLLKPGAVLILACESVEIVGHVLSGQCQQGQQIKRTPAQPAAPGTAAGLPVQLQRLVLKLEQRGVTVFRRAWLNLRSWR